MGNFFHEGNSGPKLKTELRYWGDNEDLFQRESKRAHRKKFFKHFGQVKFPPPTDININMMPFIVGYDNTIPDQCKAYIPMINACRISDFERGKVYYLTIHESMVAAGHTQRRAGLHTDRHPLIHHGRASENISTTATMKKYRKGGGGERARFEGSFFHSWGGNGGIYMASTVSNSCRVWDTYIDEPGPLGDCEDKRGDLTGVQSHLLEGNELYWITDGTPHESLPIEEGEGEGGEGEGRYRQFFRLVSSEVDVWYSQHSTPNPFGVRPTGRIVDENKFQELSLK